MQIPFTGDGVPPSRSTAHAAGADLHAAEDLTLAPGERRLVPTGLRVAIPPGHAGLVWPRSGIAVRDGIDTMAGVIDSDYRGEVRVLLINHGREPFRIRRGDRIAQLLVQRVEPAEFVPADGLPESARGEGGFGSTGR
ncbi:MAG TPA: dUTP diphosphatase [Acidobacteriota bacterium]|jgi:dUTP pyrophosphatase|nr:dUTP diphosphatase [Acidobacteriota bacterium]HNR40293.1 dUTP diphosphatase [Acidobacteriota bacterium]HNU02340.1 dUTP diphosphatase [Acidobacteriota bacterium]HPB29347.1 dUTP diphosphatase [Acidobacteriota bacterium]HQO26942.1 dUTP diphosphatase [Acidobacteriota bacterium]